MTNKLSRKQQVLFYVKGWAQLFGIYLFAATICILCFKAFGGSWYKAIILSFLMATALTAAYALYIFINRNKH